MRRIIMAAMAMAIIGCGSPNYSMPYIALEPPPHTPGRRVRGNDCTFHFWGDVRDTSLAQAVRHALEGTDANALVDVEVRREGAAELCIEVEGRIAR